MPEEKDVSAQPSSTTLADTAIRVLDNLREGLQVISPDFRYVYLNTAAASHGRSTPAVLRGRTMMEAYPGIDGTEMFDVLRRCMLERSIDVIENEFVFEDGTSNWFELRFEPVPDGLAILSLDITERKRDEEALRRAFRAARTLSRCNQTLVRAREERQFIDDVCELVVESGYVGCWLGLPDENSALVEHAHCGAEDPWGDPFNGPAVQALARCEPIVEVVGAEGEERGFQARLFLPVCQGEAAIGVLAIGARRPDAFDADELELLEEVALDLGHGIATLRERAAHGASRMALAEAEASHRRIEEQLEASQRLEAVGRLAGGVAHDFNNMLSVILSFATFAEEQLDDVDPVKQDLQEVIGAALRAADLTRQLLAFGRRQVLKPKVSNLNEVVSGMQSMIERLVREDIEISIHPAFDLGSVLADPGQLEQVLMNLVVNAADAMPSGGRLTIETKNVDLDADYAETHLGIEAGPYVLLSVADNGHGMDEVTQSRIFEPFFTTKGAGEGTGLGLSTVYGIVRQSGGTIWVYSEPGAGTTFKIYLPMVEEEVSEPRLVETSTPVLGVGRILVVEDDAGVRRAAERILQSAGYEVVTAAGGDEALALAHADDARFDLLLTDVVMPGMSGRELADRLKAEQPGLRVLFTSGYTDNAIVHHGVLEAGISFISKPFSASGLAEKVREVLAFADDADSG